MAIVVSTLSPGLAKDYKATSTYDVGEYVLHQNAYWRCTTAITIAEEWNSEHWYRDDQPLEHIYNNVDKTLKVSGAAADAKAVGDALRSGFTPWVFSGNGFDSTKTYSVFVSPSSAEGNYNYDLKVDGSFVDTVWGTTDEPTNVEFEYSGGVTATRHLITPTKTSQLTNDGPDSNDPNSGKNFATVNQIPDTTLNQVYDGNGNKFSDWTLSGSAYNPSNYNYQVSYANGSWNLKRIQSDSQNFEGSQILTSVQGTEEDLSIDFSTGSNGGIDITATRTANTLIGYKLGTTQDEKPLQPQLSSSQRSAINSGVTAEKVAEWDGLDAIKANLEDLNYAIVTHGEWEFSGEDDWFHVESIRFYENMGRWILSVSGDNWGNDYEASGTQSDTTIEFIVSEMDEPYRTANVVATKTVPHLLDRAVNIVSITDDTVLTIPDAIEGKSRDFYLKMDVIGSHEVSFLPLGMDCTGIGNPGKEYAEGSYLLHFTETSNMEFNVVDLSDPVNKSDLRYDIVEAEISNDWKFDDLPENCTATTSFNSTDSIWYLYLNGSTTASTSTASGAYNADSTYLEYGDYTLETVLYQITATRIYDLQDRASNLVTAATPIAIRCPSRITGKVRDFIVKASITAGSITMVDKDVDGNTITLLNQPTFYNGAVIRFTEVAQGVFEINTTVPTKTSDIVNDGPPAGTTPTGNQFAKVNQIPTAYESTPKEDGADSHPNGDDGVSTSWAKGDHIHPHDSTKVNKTEAYDTWSSNKSYKENDIVTYGGRVYKATQNITSYESNPANNNKWTTDGIPTIQNQLDSKYTLPSGGIPFYDLHEGLQQTINGKFNTSHVKRLSDNSVTNDDVIAGKDVKDSIESLETKADRDDVVGKRDLDELGVTGTPSGNNSWFIVDFYDTNNNKSSYRLEFDNGGWVTYFIESYSSSFGSSSDSSSSANSSNDSATYITIQEVSNTGTYTLLKTGIGTVGQFTLDSKYSAKVTHSTGDYYIYSMVDTLAKSSDLEAIDIATDSISDTSGNVINADRTVVKETQTPSHYTMTFEYGYLTPVDLEGDRDYSSATIYLSDVKYFIKLERIIDLESMVGSDLWNIRIFREKSSDSSSGSSDSSSGSSDSSGSDGQFKLIERLYDVNLSSGHAEVDTLTFGPVNLTWSNGSTILENDELALKSDIQNKVDKEAGKGLFSGSYDDLTNKPTIPAPVSVDASLTTPGAAADAKAVGDALQSAGIQTHTLTVVGNEHMPSSERVTPITLDGVLRGAIGDMKDQPPQVFTNAVGYLLGGSICFITEDTTVESWAQCFVAGTPILLSGGETKPVEDICYEDVLSVWDFDNGCVSSARPCWIKRAESISYFWRNVFSSGLVIDTVGVSGHRFFDVDSGKFEYNTDCIGHRVRMADGSTNVLVSSSRVSGTCEFYNVITDRHMNIYAGGALTSCRLNNGMYEFDVNKMMFVKKSQTRNARGIEEFTTAPDFLYKGLRLSEQTGDADDISRYIDRLVMTMKKKER